MKKLIYFCEGETEQKFIKILKEEFLIKPGQIKIFNLMQKNINSIIRKYKNSNSEFVFIIDIDTINKKLFCNNLKVLKKYKYKFCLFIQNKNFEDELTLCCNKNNKLALYKDFYYINSSNEFKSRFISDSSLYLKLINNNFDITKLWLLTNFNIQCYNNLNCNRSDFLKEN
jgi:hypothetical protein